MASDDKWGWRAVFGPILLLASLLTVLPAPAWQLWMLEVVLTEYGHCFAALALLPLWNGWPRHRADRAGTALSLAAFLLFCGPLWRAGRLARDLPAAFESLYGSTGASSLPDAQARPAPLVWTELFGISSPDVQRRTLTYLELTGMPRLELELFLPKGQGGPWPVVVVVHGGSWRSGTREELGSLNGYLAARGYAVASIDYRLAPGARFPEPPQNALAAVAYLKSHAEELGLDPTRFTLLGRSAGGEIALTAAYAAPDPSIRGVIAFYAPTDLKYAWEHPTPKRVLDTPLVIGDYMGGPPSAQAGRYELASPLLRASASSPPTLLIHGGKDELVWPGHSRRLSARLAELKRPHFLLELPWATHGCDYAFSGPCGQLSTWTVERFLKAVNNRL